MNQLMLQPLEVIMESGYHQGKALELISGANLREHLVMKNPKLDTFEKEFMVKEEPQHTGK